MRSPHLENALSHPGFDGDPETRISVLERGTPVHGTREEVPPSSCWSEARGWSSKSGRPIAQVAADLGVHREALRKRVRQAEVDAGGRPELLTSSEREELAGLRREVKELRRANEILKTASVFLPRNPTRPDRSSRAQTRQSNATRRITNDVVARLQSYDHLNNNPRCYDRLSPASTPRRTTRWHSTITTCRRRWVRPAMVMTNALAESFVDSFKTELMPDRVWRMSRPSRRSPSGSGGTTAGACTPCWATFRRPSTSSATPPAPRARWLDFGRPQRSRLRIPPAEQYRVPPQSFG
jgi:transposase